MKYEFGSRGRDRYRNKYGYQNYVKICHRTLKLIYPSNIKDLKYIHFVQFDKTLHFLIRLKKL